MALARRAFLGLAALGIPAMGVLGYAGQTGRIDLFTPVLPDEADLPALTGLQFDGRPVLGLTRSAFFQDVALLNVWASWCPDCREEHPLLMELSQRPGVQLFGLAAEDTTANASRFLAEHGNPYRRVALDAERRYQRALKHRGVPQTYVFNRRGEFVERVSGGLTRANLEARLMPAIARAKMAPPA